MLYVFGFARTAVVVGDLYFLDPDPGKGQEGPERGVRLELRLLGRRELPGSIYSAQPIEIGRPIWRADLLESVDGVPGSFDRTHHHPHVQGWEPGPRVFDKDLSADPVDWVAAKLANLEELLDEAGAGGDPADPGDAADLRACLHEIVEIVTRLLDRVRGGLAGRPPGSDSLTSVRAGWL